MSSDAILTKVETIARSVFGRDDITLSRETTAEDVAEWESITHMQLIMSVEREFGMRFSASDLASLDNVGILVDIVREKTS